MDTLAGYGSSDDEAPQLTKKVMAPSGSAAPIYPVSQGSSGGKTFVPSIREGTSSALVVASVAVNATRGAGVVAHANSRITGDMYAPVQGPAHPSKRVGIDPTTGLGKIESAAMDDYVFKNEFHANEGKRRLPKNNRGGASGNVGTAVASAAVEDEPKKKKKKKVDLKHVDDIGDAYSDPWAQPKADSEENKRLAADLDAIAARKAELEALKKKKEEEDKEKEDAEAAAAEEGGAALSLPAAAFKVEVKFHGESRVDYQGRGWTYPPPGIKARDLTDALESEASVPKKCAKKLTGHTKGVQAIEYIPGTGHLLLSAGLEGKCKIWDSCSDRNVRMTYSGHSKAVRSIAFSNTGIQFVSSGFDKLLRLWDTETGQVVGTYGNNSVGYDVKFSPSDNGEFLVAASDNRLYQWDARAGKVVQEYNYHLKSVNSLCFFDQGRRFLSTSDDKKILCWEYGVPVPTKYIADPDMYSIPAVAMHPSEEFVVGQSMDNRVVVYSVKDADKVKVVKKKVFRGHNTAGYACGLSFSPNGQYVVSGDGAGLLYLWDWRTGNLTRKFQAHDNGPCMDTAWHPLRPSWMASCGWDGVVKLWE
jgi:pre-mRNA-processing factor 17